MLSLNEKDYFPGVIGRRSFLAGSVAAAAVLAWFFTERNQPIHAEAAAAGLPKSVTIVEFTDGGQRKSSVTVDRIAKTGEEWRKQLSPSSFEVTRHAGTERPYTNENPNNYAKGVFRCICCDT